MFANSTIQINPSLNVYKSTCCTYTEKKKNYLQSICDNELHPNNIYTEGCAIKQCTIIGTIRLYVDNVELKTSIIICFHHK